MTSGGELRSLVLDAALAQALRVVDVVRDNGLEAGSAHDVIDVDGVEWHLHVLYDSDYDMVRVGGHPHAADPSSLPPMLAAMFGVRPETGGNVRFDYEVPTQWLRAAARAGEVGA